MNFSGSNPYTKMEQPKDTKNQGQAAMTPQQEPKPIKLKKDGKTPRKNNSGRNVTRPDDEWHITNITLEIGLYNFLMRNRQAIGGSISDYINKLIREDLEKNKAKYETITQMINGC